MFLEGKIWRKRNIISLQANSNYKWEEVSRKKEKNFFIRSYMSEIKRVSGCVVNRGGQEKAREKCQGKDTVKENRAQRL